MKTHRELLNINNPIHSINNYMGDIVSDDFVIVLTQTRDSDCLERCNWDAALDMLGGESDNVVIHRFGSWCCGWFEHLFVKKDTPDYEIALKIESDLEDYAVLNDDMYSEYEMNEANEVWQNCYNIKERIEYIRENRNQFEFNDLADMIACVRGKYFLGYASELIY